MLSSSEFLLNYFRDRKSVILSTVLLLLFEVFVCLHSHSFCQCAMNFAACFDGFCSSKYGISSLWTLYYYFYFFVKYYFCSINCCYDSDIPIKKKRKKKVACEIDTGLEYFCWTCCNVWEEMNFFGIFTWFAIVNVLYFFFHLKPCKTS